MLDTFPGHVSDVQQAVDTTEINERAVVGKVFNNAFDCLAFLQIGQQLITLNSVD